MEPEPRYSGRDWHLDTSSRELFRPGRTIRLAEKPFRVLVALLEARGGVVTRESLQRRLWADDTIVDFDNNLNSAVATLRHAFGDSAKAPAFIETIPKVGYRFAWIDVPPAAASVEGMPAVRHPLERVGRGRTVATAATAALVVLGSVIGFVLGARSWTVRSDVDTPVSANPDVRDLMARGTYLRGRFLASHADPELLVRALEAFEEAARLDPQLAAAAAEEADTLVEMSFAGAVRFREGLARARDAAQRARARAPDQAVAARVLGLAALFLDWNFDASRSWLDRARAGGPDARTSLALATWFAAAGQPGQAVRAAERAVALEPAAYYVRADLAMFYLVSGRLEEAAESSRRVLELAPDFVPALTHALVAHERLGRWTEAARDARALMLAAEASAQDVAQFDAADGRDAVDHWRRWDLTQLERRATDRRADFALALALRYAALGDRTAAIDALELALENRIPWLVFLRGYPDVEGLRGDPRFEAVASEVRRGSVAGARPSTLSAR